MTDEPIPSTAPQSVGEEPTQICPAVARVTAYLDEETKYAGGVSPRHWPNGPHLSYGDLRDILAALQSSEAARTLAETALTKINAIRNSIIGCQKVNWSEHIYPLVAALEEAGIEGQDYPEARANVGTLIERTNAAEARATLTEARVEELESELDRAKIALGDARAAHAKTLLCEQAAETQLTASKSRVGELEEGLNRALNALAMITVSWGLTPDDDDGDGWFRKADTKRSQAQTALAELGWGIDWNAIGAGETDPNKFRALLSPSQGGEGRE